MFVYELCCSGFQSFCNHLNWINCNCFEQVVTWHWSNYIVRIHSETRTWHYKNIRSNASYRYVLTTQINHLTSLGKGWVFIYKLSDCGLESRCSHLKFRYRACSKQEFLDIQETIQCGFTLKQLRKMIGTCSQIHRKISFHNTAQSFSQFDPIIEYSFTN